MPDWFCPCGGWLAQPEPPLCLDCEELAKKDLTQCTCGMPLHPDDRGECWDCRYQRTGDRPLIVREVSASFTISSRRQTVNAAHRPPLRECSVCGWPAARTTDTTVVLYCLDCYKTVTHKMRMSRREVNPSVVPSSSPSLEHAPSPAWDLDPQDMIVEVPSDGVRSQQSKCNRRGHPARDCLRSGDQDLRRRRRRAAKEAKRKQRARDSQVVCTWLPDSPPAPPAPMRRLLALPAPGQEVECNSEEDLDRTFAS